MTNKKSHLGGSAFFSAQKIAIDKEKVEAAFGDFGEIRNCSPGHYD
ncbi:MAG TPA: hypothetical protein VMY06_03255 [Sedimentisphaerales bacterium]|nr:hypothetical protein [Sedimentisphaerales bacterium]